MTEDFDKEIDALLRQAARGGENVSAAHGAHLDADELNAFAERTLPEKARLRATEHLADCARCRSILSNLTDFNVAPTSKIFPAVETEISAVPWYRRLFVFPQIAYVMGVLTLIFSGIIGIAVLKNREQNDSSQVAQINEKSLVPTSEVPASKTANGASADSSSSYANSSLGNFTLPAANSTGKTVTAANSNQAVARNNSGDALKPGASLDEKKKEKSDSTAPFAAPPLASRENNYTVDGTDSMAARRAESPPNQQDSAAQNQTASQSPPAPESRKVQSLPINGRRARSPQMARSEAEPENSASDKVIEAAKPSAAKNVGGKSFRHAGGVWYDVNYKNQKIINIARGSNEYQKLDENLRSIAEKLGGAVVIVADGKAYRIE